MIGALARFEPVFTQLKSVFIGTSSFSEAFSPTAQASAVVASCALEYFVLNNSFSHEALVARAGAFMSVLPRLDLRSGLFAGSLFLITTPRKHAYRRISHILGSICDGVVKIVNTIAIFRLMRQQFGLDAGIVASLIVGGFSIYNAKLGWDQLKLENIRVQMGTEILKVETEAKKVVLTLLQELFRKGFIEDDKVVFSLTNIKW